MKNEINFTESAAVATSFIFAVMMGNIPSYLKKKFNSINSNSVQISCLKLGKITKKIYWHRVGEEKNAEIKTRYIRVMDNRGDHFSTLKLEKELNYNIDFGYSNSDGWKVTEASFLQFGQWKKVIVGVIVLSDVSSEMIGIGWCPNKPAVEIHEALCKYPEDVSREMENEIFSELKECEDDYS